jgi:glyoxylase-like metal-dependent hydrolase (beta-lactamase superfamily II)
MAVPPLPLSRRTFLADLGRGAVAIAVFGVAGCATPASSSRPTTAIPGPSSSPPGSPSTEPSATAAAGASAGGSGAPTDGFDWERVPLGVVSAYILVRGGEAVLVDTGVAGRADEIEAALGGIGLGWDAVGHLVITHHHGDHAGSARAIMDLAPGLAAYAGAADIPSIDVPRPLRAVDDGDEVGGLRIVATPGHTAGHVAVLDEMGGILVAGDALGTVGGPLAGSNPRFTADMEEARRSVVKLGTLRFETLLVGHGEPITSGASVQVAALGASS